jgi:hypothetical protein
MIVNNGLYFSIILFKGTNIDIHHIIMFFSILLPLVSMIAAKFFELYVAFGGVQEIGV